MATAQVIFQRFYYSKSLVKHDGEVRNIFVHVRKFIMFLQAFKVFSFNDFRLKLSLLSVL